MCHVHRVIPESNNSALIVSYEPPQKADRRTTISTSALFAMANGEKVEDTITVRDSLGLTKKVPVRQRDPLMVCLRRKDSDRMNSQPIADPKHFDRPDDNEPWCTMHPANGYEIKRLQREYDETDFMFGGKTPKAERLASDSWETGCGPRFNGTGSSYRNLGKKPRYKDYFTS